MVGGAQWGLTEFSWIWVWRARVFKAAGGHTSSNSACSRDLCGRGRWQGTCEWALAKSCGVTRLREPARAEGSCLSSRQCSSAIPSAASSERDKKISPLTKRRPGKQNRPSDCTIFLSTSAPPVAVQIIGHRGIGPKPNDERPTKLRASVRVPHRCAVWATPSRQGPGTAQSSVAVSAVASRASTHNTDRLQL